jgi:uncharacterized OB-fold protein
VSVLEPNLATGIDLCVDRWTEPFWNAAREHRLVVARCTSCGRFRSPPTPYCANCLSQEIDWIEVPGDATVYTFTVVRHPPAPSLAGKVPYVIAIVILGGTDGIKFMTNVVNCTPADVHIGMTLNVVWDDTEQGISVPRFGP